MHVFHTFLHRPMLTQAAPGIPAGKRHSPMDALAAKQAALASILSVGSVGSTMAPSPKASLQPSSSFPDGATPGSDTFVPAPVAATISSPKQALVAARHRQQAAALAQAQAQVQAQASSPRSAASSPRAPTSPRAAVAAASSSPQAATLAAIGRQTSAAEHEMQQAVVQAQAAHAVLMQAKAELQAAQQSAHEQARQAAEAKHTVQRQAVEQQELQEEQAARRKQAAKARAKVVMGHDPEAEREAAEAAAGHEIFEIEPLGPQQQPESAVSAASGKQQAAQQKVPPQQAEITAADEQLPVQPRRPSSRSAAAKLPAPVVWDQAKPRPADPEAIEPTAAGAAPAGPAAAAAAPAALPVQTGPQEMAPVPRSGNIIADPNPPPEAAASSTSAAVPALQAPAQTSQPAAAAVASSSAGEQVRKQYAYLFSCMHGVAEVMPPCTHSTLVDPVTYKPAACTQPCG